MGGRGRLGGWGWGWGTGGERGWEGFGGRGGGQRERAGGVRLAMHMIRSISVHILDTWMLARHDVVMTLPRGASHCRVASATTGRERDG